MKKEIIVKKIDWGATLNQFEVEDTQEFHVAANVMVAIRQVASRVKKNTGKKFTTSIQEDSIIVTRIA